MCTTIYSFHCRCPYIASLQCSLEATFAPFIVISLLKQMKSPSSPPNIAAVTAVEVVHTVWQLSFRVHPRASTLRRSCICLVPTSLHVRVQPRFTSRRIADRRFRWSHKVVSSVCFGSPFAWGRILNPRSYEEDNGRAYSRAGIHGYGEGVGQWGIK